MFSNILINLSVFIAVLIFLGAVIYRGESSFSTNDRRQPESCSQCSRQDGLGKCVPGSCTAWGSGFVHFPGNREE